MTEDRRIYYERTFQELCNANILFDKIRDILGCKVSEFYDDPASTAIDMGLESLIHLYIAEEFSIYDIWDELWEGLYDYLSDPKWNKDEKFSLSRFDDMICDCLDELADRESAYPEEIENDRKCVL